jgi:hypothetical protein
MFGSGYTSMRDDETDRALRQQHAAHEFMLESVLCVGRLCRGVG